MCTVIDDPQKGRIIVFENYLKAYYDPEAFGCDPTPKWNLNICKPMKKELLQGIWTILSTYIHKWICSDNFTVFKSILKKGMCI